MAEPSPEVREMLFRKVKADPASFYDAPGDVAADKRFAAPQKLAILEQWRDDLRRLPPEAAAADLPRVERAMAALGAAPPARRQE